MPYQIFSSVVVILLGLGAVFFTKDMMNIQRKLVENQKDFANRKVFESLQKRSTFFFMKFVGLGLIVGGVYFLITLL